MRLLKCDKCGKMVDADKNHDIRLIKVYEYNEYGHEIYCSQYFHLCKNCLKKVTKEEQ